MNNYRSWAGSLILFPIVVLIILNAGNFIPILDHFNLLIHEGGHGLFRAFGRIVYTLGGTVMQILIPSLFIFYFFSHRKRFGVQVSLVWLGESLMNVGFYAADARVQKISLLGGNKVYHDWGYLLGKMDLLQYDHILGISFFSAGIMVFILSLIFPLIMRDYQASKLYLGI